MNLVELIKQDRIWAYCLSAIGITMWGVDRHRRRLEEFHARHQR